VLALAPAGNRVRAGTVGVNCYDVFDAAAPFGGFKQSGIGPQPREAVSAGGSFICRPW